MKRLSMGLIVSILLISSANTAAASSSLGVKGETGQLLSQTTTVTGSGTLGGKDGAASSASFRTPAGIALHPDGTVWIADSKSHLIRRLSGGHVATQAGWTAWLDEKGFPSGTLLDGPRGETVFQYPQGMAIDKQGNVYVADTENHAIRQITAAGTVTVAGDGVQGKRDGQGEEARFHSPADVAVAADGTLYVTDTLNHAIRKISPDGTVTTLNDLSERLVEIVPGYVEPAGDYKDGELSSARFNEPSGIVMDEQGNLFVSDTGNQLIRYIDLQRGTVSTVAGDASLAYPSHGLYKEGDYNDGEADKARFNFPRGIALTSEGGLVIADSLNHSIRYLHEGRVMTLAGSPEKFGNGDGIESEARFHMPLDVSVDREDHVWVADSYNHTIRQIEFYRYPDTTTRTGSMQIFLGQKQVEFERPPQNVAGRTMVPVRALGEALGAEVLYTETDEARHVALVKDGLTLQMTIGESELAGLRDGTEIFRKSLDAAPFLEGDYTFVPLRFFSEEMGLDVQWDSEYNAVILREKLR
ncbi:stalk domain-containing protein [Paenibacillus sp. J2TS4]|uniref:stalk domain-containing protein n=1 Tax=Paenibacillus sp. J2TS4 TaxID=2807194 RepID=UPI001B09A804|nr:stalk domain-containing protein [Paenibacillus sp. J2TS4]GIP33346.1 hypothetical protein J2TS4_25560 [Paenibacillus sp. J2TS4]